MESPGFSLFRVCGSQKQIMMAGSQEICCHYVVTKLGIFEKWDIFRCDCGNITGHFLRDLDMEISSHVWHQKLDICNGNSRPAMFVAKQENIPVFFLSTKTGYVGQEVKTSPAVCGDNGSCFKLKYDLSLTLTNCLNLTKAFAQSCHKIKLKIEPLQHKDMKSFNILPTTFILTTELTLMSLYYSP